MLYSTFCTSNTLTGELAEFIQMKGRTSATAAIGERVDVVGGHVLVGGLVVGWRLRSLAGALAVVALFDAAGHELGVHRPRTAAARSALYLH